MQLHADPKFTDLHNPSAKNMEQIDNNVQIQLLVTVTQRPKSTHKLGAKVMTR